MWTPDPSTIITAEQKQAEAQAALLTMFRLEVQKHLDATAQQRQYDGTATIVTYVASTNPQWAAEAQAFVAWRDAVWAYAVTELDKVIAGGRPQPTVEEFIAELPAFDWPQVSS